MKRSSRFNGGKLKIGDGQGIEEAQAKGACGEVLASVGPVTTSSIQYNNIESYHIHHHRSIRSHRPRPCHKYINTTQSVKLSAVIMRVAEFLSASSSYVPTRHAADFASRT